MINEAPVRSRRRILYVSYLPPSPTSGGAYAFHRHFVERPDFDVRVATNADPAHSPYFSPKWHRFQPSRLFLRLLRTRLSPYLFGVHLLWAKGRTPRTLVNFAEEFRPEAVFTIAGSWDYSALIAQNLARRLRVPLIASFNDWFSYGGFPVHPLFHSTIERRFRTFYRQADLALCTSEGMRAELGPHRNAHVLYPIGATRSWTSPPRRPTARFTIGFGGNLGEWYGRMIETLVDTARQAAPDFCFKVFGPGPSWSAAFDAKAKAEGLYLGQVPFDHLRNELAGCDVLLLPMGFEPKQAIVERTSFKTKFLDYLTFDRPIVIWGPPDCSAAVVAREFNSAEVCTEESPQAVIRVLRDLSQSCARQQEIVRNGAKMLAGRFNPEVIHQGLVAAIERTINTYH